FNAASNNNAYTVNVNATDTAGNVKAQAIVVNVTDVNEAPTVVAQTPASSVLVNQAANLNVATAFGDPDTQATDATWHTLTYAATGLLDGLTINTTTGVISGTATATTASAASITVTATDGGGLNITETFNLSVVSAPVISSFTVSDTTTTNGAQLGKSGEALVFVVTMSEAVTVTPATGAVAPQITFSVNGQTVTATYASGSGTALLTFTGGTVPASGNGTAISITSIALNGGTVTGNSSAQNLAIATVGQSYAGYTVDNTAPLAPTLKLASDTGSSASDSITSNTTINVFGLESGATWQYQEDNGTWADGTGSSFTASTGEHSYLVRQIDVAGNTRATSTAVTYTFDTSAPATLSLTLASDTGISASDNLTSNATINVSGLESGATWQYQEDNSAWLTGTGASFIASTGTHSYSVRQTDAAGNTSTTNAVTYTFDTSALAPNLTLASDTGSSASDRITSNPTINVTGLVTGGTWQYQVDSSAWATGTASSLIASSGAHTYFVRQTDAMGNISTQSVAVIYTLDTSAVAPTLSLAADTGPNSTDGLTNNPTIVVTGLESGAVWQYKVDSTGTWTTATASGTSATFTAMSGSHSYVVQQSDVAGNASPVSTAVTFNLDTSSPNMIVAGGGGSIAAGDLGAVTFTADARDVGSETGTNSDELAVNAPAIANLTWALGSGADTALFDLNNGVLRFKTPPNLLTPRGAPFDANANPNTYLVYVIATDAAGNESEPTAVAITVSNINSPPRATASIASQTDEQAVLTDQAANLDISGAFTDANTGSTERPDWGALTYTATGLPEGLRLNATTGVISGRGERTENAVLVTVTATDGGGLSATTSFAMEVDDPSILEGTFYAGPVIKNVILSVRAVNLNGVPIKDKNGNVITAPINSDGSYRLNLGNNVGTKVGDREGVLTVQVVDNNGPAGDYHDEATGTIKSAGNNFSATVVVSKGFKQSAHVNTLSSIASKIILRSNVARLSAEQEHGTIVNGGNDFAAIPAAAVIPVTKGFVNQVNLQVGKSFLNIGNADVTKIRPTPTILVTEENGVTTVAANTPPPNADTNPQVLVGRMLTVLSAAEQLPKSKLLLSNVYAKLTQKATATSSTPAQALAAEADSVGFLTALAAVAAIDDTSADSELNAALQDLYVQAGARLIAATDGGVTTGLSTADVDTVLQTITPASVLILADKDVILKNNGALGTATVRFKFANAPLQYSFSADDLIVTGGTLSNFQWDVTGTLCTATFTPAAGTSATEATITLFSTASIDFRGIDGLPVTYRVGNANYPLTSNSAGFKFALGIPEPSLELDQDSGVSATDNLTNNNQAHVFGLVGGTGNSWQYQVDGSSWISGGSGNSFTLSSGVHTYMVRQINGSETATASGSLVYTLDTTPPAPATLRLASDTGVNASDSLTNNPSILVSGLESGASWQYQVDSTVGLWLTGAGTSFTASSGVHSYFVRQVDTAGNDGVISTAFIYTLDTNLPSLPVLSLASDTGINASDGITNNATIDVSGLESAATWSYRVDGGIWLEGTGTRFIASSGAHSYFVRQTDAAGNLGTSSNAVFYTLDTTPPTDTMTLNTQIAGDNTVSANEAYAGVIMEGTATPNGIVTLTLGRITKTALADANGVWSVTVEASDWGRVGRGTYTLSGAITDVAGNLSTSAATATLTVANDMPLREIVLTTIAAGTGGFAITGETAGDASGYSVSVAGDVNGDGLADVILGAPRYGAGAGRSYVVFGKANSNAVNLSAVAAGTDGFVIHGEAAGDASGYSVSAAGDVNGDGLADVIVGAYQNDASGNNAGRAYLVFGKTNTIAVHLSAVAAGTGGFAFGGETVDDFSGRSVSAAGDVNGDGLGDLLVGAPHSYDNSVFTNASPAGKSYLLFGKSNWSGVSTLNLSAVAQGSGGFVLNGENGASGSALGSLGDINGDGYADFIVGASYARPFWAGKSYVVFGKANWSGTSAVNLADVAAGTGGFALTGSELLELSAHSVAAVGDVNGDGYADFLLGSLMNFRVGRSYLVFGRANWTDVGTLSLSTIAAGSGGFVVLGEDNLDSSGNVAAAGDVNGDGLADFIIGAPGSYGLPYTGKSYVVFGKANSSAINLHDVAAGTGGFVVTGEANYDSSGASVSAAGDINGDGLADLLVGAFNNDAGGSSAGRSYVIFGGTQWIANTVQGSGSVTGTSASEAIIGSSGADTLTGNGGIDRFFAGAGNDTIALTSSDIANLISTTPTAVTGGHVLATIDGGAGIDSIQLFGGANLDLSAISNSSGINPKTKSRIASIERIDLASDSAANSVTVSVGDVVDMAGFNLFNTTKGWTVSATGTVTGFGASTPYHQLLVDGTATDGIVLTSSEWTRQSGTVTGNVSGTSQSYNVYVNSAKNAMLLVGSVIQRIPPPPVLRLASDTGISASDGISNNATITVSGLEAGATWQYRVDQGNWQSGAGTKFNASAGQHSYSVRQANAGITSAASTAVTFSLDTSPPSAPSIVTPIASDDTVNASEVKAGVTIQGRAEANASVTLKLSRISKTVFANASGDWLVTLNAADWGRIESGTYDLTVEQTDVAGNGSNPATVTVTVENDAPLREIFLNKIAAGTGGFAISVGATEDGTQAQEAGDRSGWSVSAAGDVNGDGWADVLIGAPESEAGGYAAGRGYVVFGKADGAEVNVRDVAAGSGGFVLTGETAVDQSGFSVSAAGDVNGDGLADLFVGAPARLSGRAGRSYVVFGKTNTSAVNLSAVAAGSGGFVISGEAAGDESGISVAALGDVNGDGLADLLIGARYNGAGHINAGRSYVVFGKTNTSVVNLSAVAAGTGGFAMTGEAASDYSGSAVSAAGDVNGDGLADLLVGAPYNDAGGTNAGRSYVIFGKANTSAVSLSAVAAGTGGFAMTGEIRGDQSGISVAAAGDVNGDGLADVLVGALYNDAGGGNAGRSYVVFGKANTKAINLSAVVAGTGGFAITGEAGGDQSGFSVSAAGDMNGDGLADLLVGAPNNDVGGGNAGRSYVVFGKANTSAVHLSAVAAGSGGFAITGEMVGDQSGFSVSAAGDVNGDGLSDLLVGAPYSDVGGAGAGRSYVVFGGTQWLTRSVQGAGTVNGTVNGEAIIGSSGADILTGNGGIDRFFAGAGDDTIVLTASDIANLASNTPSNNTLATLDGGLGLDSVRLAGGANLDLTAIKISNALNSKTLSRIAGVERIDLATDDATNILTLSVDDVRELQGFNLFNTNNGWTLNGAVTGFGTSTPYHQLVVDGTASDGIVLTSSEWVRQSGTVTGNVSGVNQSYSVYVNTSKNAMLLLDSDIRRLPLPPLLRLVSDTGSNPTDGITNNATITVSGLEDGASWRYRVDGGSWLAGAGTSFIATSGQHSYVVQQTDSANNTSFASTAVTYTLTTTRLNPPTISAPIAGDNIVSASEAAAGVAVQGTAEANASLIVTLGGISKTVTANASGAWSTTLVANEWQRMGRGVHILTVATTQTDVAGNLGVATLSVTNEVTLGEILLSNIAAGRGGFAMTGEAVDDGSGGSVTAAGDVNGDGLMDVLVSAYRNNAGGANTGRSYVVFGKANSSTIHLSAVAAGTGGFAITGEGSGDWPSALSMAAIGDMNGDGLSDVLIGVALQDAGGYDAGRSYVVFGKTDTSAVSLSAVAAGTGGFAMTGEGFHDQSGYSVSGAGDVNGDGLADVIVGATFNDAANYDAGRSYVVFGKANTSGLNLRSVAAGTGGFAITGRRYSNETGASVSGAGDVNGDGLADLLVGVNYNPYGGDYDYARNSYVVFGKTTTNDVNLDSVAAGTGGFAISGETFYAISGGILSFAYSGWKVVAAGDVNGDGLADVLVSLPWHDAGGVDAGRSYVVFGKASGATVNINDIVAGTGGFAITGEAAGDYSGSSLAAAGDVNGDGLSDVLVSAPNNGGNTGRSYVVYGKTNTSAVSLSAVVVGSGGFAITGEAAGDKSGASVSAAGDINGDGLADLLIGAPYNDAGG
ncbi:MAG: Ig-like domain-containing protein, partial [Methylophilaceae bacterium]|nr:Ig-like domain-containing protein [Methylophilaceae bacterium]